MTLAMELHRQQRIGHEEMKRETILAMASMQMPAEIIAQAVRRSPAFVESILSQNA